MTDEERQVALRSALARIDDLKATIRRLHVENDTLSRQLAETRQALAVAEQERDAAVAQYDAARRAMVRQARKSGA